MVPQVEPAAPLRLHEAFPDGYQYHVSCRVEIAGTLTLPAEKRQGGDQSLKVAGTSAIEYDERILDPGKAGEVLKTARVYRRIDFQRTVGDRPQDGTIRPLVRRLIVLRLKNKEVPFSPDGPLTWGEIDLVRTDVFTPALAGMLPDHPVRVGDRWTAEKSAIEELTDMERIDDGQVNCRLDDITLLSGRRLARVSFLGRVRGVNEDGPNSQDLDGYYFFDLMSNHLSYLSLKGVNSMLDRTGKALGSISGIFVLTRQASQPSADLSDEALKSVPREPTPENTMLLYDNSDLGIRFLYPRRWHIGRVSGSQITVDEANGSGLLLTIEPLSRFPGGAQFLAETRNYLQQQKAKVYRIDPPRRLPAQTGELEQFTIDADVAGQRAILHYFVVRQASGGVLVSARLLPRDAATLRSEVEGIARSVQLDVKKEIKPSR
jgi:hypothetical protein